MSGTLCRHGGQRHRWNIGNDPLRNQCDSGNPHAALSAFCQSNSPPSKSR